MEIENQPEMYSGDAEQVIQSLIEYPCDWWGKKWLYQADKYVVSAVDKQSGDVKAKTILPYFHLDGNKTLTLGSGGWTDAELLHLNFDLDVGHGEPGECYQTTTEAITAAKTLRTFVGGAAELRHSKGGHGVQARVKLPEEFVWCDGDEIHCGDQLLTPAQVHHDENSKHNLLQTIGGNIALWLKVKIGLKCDMVVARQQIMDIWAQPHLIKGCGYDLIEECQGEWKPPLEAVTHQHHQAATPANQPQIDNPLVGLMPVDERKEQYSRYILSKKYPEAVMGSGGQLQLSKAIAVTEGFGLKVYEALDVIEEYNQVKCKPPFPSNEVEDKIKASKYWGTFGDKLRRHYELNDSGNALRLIDGHHQDLLYCTDKEVWFCWNQGKWQQDETALVRRMNEARQGIAKDAAKKTDEKLKKVLKAWHTQSGNSSRINAAINIAKAHTAVQRQSTIFDAEKHLLNVTNGIVDLKTAQLMAHDRNLFCANMTMAAYNPEAKCDLFLATLKKVLVDDGVIEWLQRWLGYCLTGDTSEKLFVIGYGVSNSAKSTIFETVAKVIGDYATTIEPRSLYSMENEGNSPRNDLACLHNKRYVVAGESKHQCKLDEALVKKLTGGIDKIKARFLYEELFEFVPHYKVIIHTNHKPELSGDDALWNRIRLIPFNISIPPSEIKRGFEEQLKTEYDGILAWMVQGSKAWFERGLAENTVIAQATAGYKGECDAFESFCDNCLDFNTAEKVKSSEVYNAYKLHCREFSYSELNHIEFGAKFKAKYAGIHSFEKGVNKYKVKLR